MEWNWNEIKSEYVSSDVSYRQLCDKYGVPLHKLRVVAQNEKWVALREQARHKADIKIIEKVAQQGANHTLKIYEVADKLLEKIEDTLEAMEVIDSQSLKHFTSALKDLKDIRGIKSDIDLREQEARIEKLRKDAMVEEEDKDIKVHMGEEADKYGD